MRIYCLRHGESVLNTTEDIGEIPADWDRLSELGHRQAEQLGKRLEHEGLTHLITSPLIRAKETAEGINRTLRLPLEVHDGIYEYRSPSKLYTLPLEERGDYYASKWMREHDDPDFALEDAESFNHIMGRVDAFLKFLEGYPSDRNVGVITHRNFLGLVALRILIGDEAAPRHFSNLYCSLGSANTGISILEYDPDHPWPQYQARPGWSLMTWMDHAHL